MKLLTFTLIFIFFLYGKSIPKEIIMLCEIEIFEKKRFIENKTKIYKWYNPIIGHTKVLVLEGENWRSVCPDKNNDKSFTLFIWNNKEKFFNNYKYQCQIKIEAENSLSYTKGIKKLDLDFKLYKGKKISKGITKSNRKSKKKVGINRTSNLMCKKLN